MPKIPYLGKLLLKWCPACNVPVVKAINCSKCQSQTFDVKITVPGDFRPAFKGDIHRLQETIDKDYGPLFGRNLVPDDKIVVLNKVPGLDLVEEVILDGKILGTLFFDPFSEDFHFSLKYEGGLRLFYYAMKKGSNLPRYIEYSDEGFPFLVSGKSVVVPGIVKLSDDLRKKERCILTSEKGYLGVALVTQDMKEIQKLMQEKRGLIAKPKEVKDPIRVEEINIPKGGQTLENVFAANKKHLEMIITKAKHFIKSTKDKFSELQIAVAYSGGKDSLATLLLVYEALGPEFFVFFADTGIEFPEVIEHTKLTIDLLGLSNRFHQRTAGEKFWDLVGKFGPPARDFRYCCHSLKAQQIISIIQELAGEGKIIVFLGQRRYESFSRAQDQMIYTNSYIPAQISATPIKNWTAFEVWIFLLSNTFKGKPFPLNDLYFRGHERLGCFLCPSMNLATRQVMRETHKDLIARWDAFLENYAKQMNLPHEWVKFGLWRSKKLNKLWANVVEDLEIEIKPKSKDEKINVFNVTTGFAPCVKGGYSLKGKFEKPIDISKIERYLQTLPGTIKVMDKQGVLNLQNNEFYVDIFSDGSLYVRFLNEKKDYEDTVYLLVGIIARSQACTACGVCVQICPSKSIQLKEQSLRFDREKCVHCGRCTLQCPLFKLAAREIHWEENEVI